MFEIRKAVVVFSSILGWLGMAFGFLYGSIMVVTFQAKSMGASMFIVLACALAFWSFYRAYQKSRRSGNASFAHLYEDLGFRFCLTPLVVCALIFVIGLNTAP